MSGSIPAQNRHGSRVDRAVDYQFKSIGKTCAATGQPLKPGTRCHSVLVDRDGQMLRLDFSDEGWNGPPEDAVGEWVTVMPDDQSHEKEIDPDSLMTCFEQMCEDPNPAQDQMRYVLAVLLLQKRRLRLEGSRTDEDGNGFLQLHGVRGEGEFEIADQEMDEDEINALQAALRTQLAEEWNS